MQMIKRHITAFLLCLVLLSALVPTCAGAAEALDTSRPVTLAVNYRHEGAPVAGVHFSVYYVASVDESLTFHLSDDFRAYPIRLDNLDNDNWRLLAETLSGYVKRDNRIPQDDGDTGADGVLQFPNRRKSMSSGLYLVVAENMNDGKYNYTTEPLLICLPNRDAASGVWLYDVTVVPKHTRTLIPDDPTAETITRHVLKTWRGDTPETRPSSITVRLLKDGTEYAKQTLTAVSSWTYTWSDLPMYNADKTLISWTLVEDAVDGYTPYVQPNGVTVIVTNTANDTMDKTVTRRVYKQWDDKGYESKRPSAVTVYLLADGKQLYTQQLTAANNWTYTWDNLPRCDAAGKEITWTLKEATVSGYTSDITQSGANFIVTNSITKAKLPQTGSLWWLVPVLAAAGLAFIAVGLLRRRMRKNDE